MSFFTSDLLGKQLLMWIFKTGNIILPLWVGNIVNKWKIIEDFEQKRMKQVKNSFRCGIVCSLGGKSCYVGNILKGQYTGCPRRKGQNFGRVSLMLKHTDITQNTYIQSWTVTEIMAREVWNFDSCYTLIDYQIHIKTGRNMWLL